MVYDQAKKVFTYAKIISMSLIFKVGGKNWKLIDDRLLFKHTWTVNIIIFLFVSSIIVSIAYLYVYAYVSETRIFTKFAD